MSYATMDHAGWVESNIAASKAMVARRKPRRDGYGIIKGWHAAPDTLSPFQAKVMDILGMTFGGIYNAPISWDAVQWTGWGRDGIGVPIYHTSLSTFDGMSLTRLVLLSHEARIRCEVRANGVRGLLLAFWQRRHDGGTADRHPSIDEAVASFREYLPDGHRVSYRAANTPSTTGDGE
jgi:hypothetical protein